MTGIEWTDETWNPTSGCDQVSPGCDNCYALGMAKRLKAMGQPGYQRDGDPRTSGPGFGLTVHPDRLNLPLRWRKPRKVFVNSMSDLFHQGVSDEFIARVWAVMALAPQHTFQILTKRHARMRSLLNAQHFCDMVVAATSNLTPDPTAFEKLADRPWPLPNIWLGVSVENQKWADLRIPALLSTPAAVRWISAEPLLGPVDLTAHMPEVPYWDSRETEDWGIGWVVAGGESGPGARPMHPAWARQLRDQCAEAGVPFHFKQRGAWTWDGPEGDPDRPSSERNWLGMDGKWMIRGGPTPSIEMWRVGKKRAGRVLDGVQHDGYPEVARV